MSFRAITDQLAEHGGLQSRLRQAWRRVVVYERIAGWDGLEYWFVADTPDLLHAVLRQLRPCSTVTFYFADRIRMEQQSPAVREQLTALLEESHEVLIGRRGPRACDLTIGLVSNADELDRVLGTIPRGSEVYWTGWPGPANDDVVSVALVDEDGSLPKEVVRAGS